MGGVSMEKIPVCAYCRVSTNSKDQKNSFDNQKNYFEKIERESEIYDLGKIYADEGISAVSLKKRDDFLNMVHDCGIDVKIDGNDYMYKTDNNREPIWKKILIKDISRFSRNLDTISLVRALRRKGVSIVATNIGMEFATEQDEFNLSLLLTFAQHESVDRSKKVKFGLQRSAEEGKVKMAQPLYGYEYDPETKDIYVVEYEAEIVKMIFSLYVDENLGLRKIMQILKEKGIKTRQGNDFGYSTLSRMISNRKYCGDIVYLKYDSGTVLNKYTSHKIRPEEDWVIIENGIDNPIISREIFNNAQEIRLSRAEDNGNYRGRKHANTEYSNLIKCGNCGAYYGRNKANGEYFLNCMTKKRYGVKECDYPNIKVTDLDEIIEKIGEQSLYKSIIYNKNEKIELLNNLKEQLKNKINDEVPPEFHEKQKELTDLKIKKEKLLDLYLDGNMDKSILDKKNSEINSTIDILEKELWVITMPLSEIEDQIKNIEKRIDELTKMKIKKVYSKKEILDLIMEIEVKHIFRVIQLKIKLKDTETINKAIETLNISKDEIKDMVSPLFYFQLPVSRNVQTRIPDELYVLKDGIDPEKHQQELEQHMVELRDKYNKYTKE
jgi:site-specific DNA recombinase